MTFTLTIHGDTPAELLDALKHLDVSPLTAAQPPVKAACAARKAKPSETKAQTEQPAQSPAAASAALPEPASPAPAQPAADSADQRKKVKDLATVLVAAGKSNEVREIIRAAGVRALPQVPAEQLHTVWESLLKIKEALDAAD